MPRRPLLLLLSACAVTGAALAEEPRDSTAPLRIVITKTDCQRLLRHTPSADVAYKPGVDAKGRKVAPADLDGGAAAAMAQQMVPDVIEFPITVNPVKYQARKQAYRDKAAATTDAEIQAAEASLADISAKGLDNTTMSVGTVKYDIAKGLFTFNGQPIGDDAAGQLSEGCKRRGVR